jgi:hypothetical protein
MPSIPPPIAAYSPAETWYWNGLALSQKWWNITTFGGSRSGIPTLRGQDIPVPYRAGQAWRAKYPDERTISLTMWLDGSGSAANAWPAADPRLAFNDNWKQLRQAFFTRGAGGSVQGQLQRNWYYTQGGSPTLVQSTAMAEIAGSMDLSMNGRLGAAFTADFLLADPYFYGAQQTQAVTTSGTITNLGDGVAGEGFPSPISTFSVQCSAPCTVTNSTAGISFILASGPSYPVTVDVLNGLITDNGGASVPAKFSHSGGRLWMGLVSGANSIAVSAGTATFTWTPPYI